MRKIKMNTNTAYLLNTWFPVDSMMWKIQREFIKDAHEDSWKGLCESDVEITFKIISKKVQD